jgi:hypothetical protein
VKQKVSSRERQRGSGLCAPAIPSELSNDVFCPLCAYNMRGLNQPRCPECGTQYLWSELLDPRGRKHPFLFEHHSDRNWGSALRTLRAGLRPQEFWSTMHPMQTISLSRLFTYAGVTFVSMCMIYGGAVVAQQLAQSAIGRGANGTGLSSGLRNLSIVDATTVRIASTDFLVVCLTPLMCGLFVFLTYMVFGMSMKRARIKRAHIARTVVYAFDVVIWLALAHLALYVVSFALLEYCNGDERLAIRVATKAWAGLLIASYFWLTSGPSSRDSPWVAAIMSSIVGLSLILGVLIAESVINDGDWSAWIVRPIPMSPLLLLFGWAVFFRRLVTAFRQYLRFRHVVAVVLASHVIAALAVIICIQFGMVVFASVIRLF